MFLARLRPTSYRRSLESCSRAHLYTYPQVVRIVRVHCVELAKGLRREKGVCHCASEHRYDGHHKPATQYHNNRLDFHSLSQVRYCVHLRVATLPAEALHIRHCLRERPAKKIQNRRAPFISLLGFARSSSAFGAARARNLAFNAFLVQSRNSQVCCTTVFSVSTMSAKHGVHLSLYFEHFMDLQVGDLQGTYVRARDCVMCVNCGRPTRIVSCLGTVIALLYLGAYCCI